jgi:hypothetical protein
LKIFFQKLFSQKNAMKNRFCALLFLLPALGFAQKTGEYVLSYAPLGGKVITILKKHRFEYQFNHCTGRVLGKGFYVQKDSILTLNFETNSNIPQGKVEVHKTPTESDSISVNVTVLDATRHGEPLFVVNVICMKNNIKIDDTETDFEGKASFKFPKSKDSLTFSVSFIGFDDAKITIATDENYTLSFLLADNFIQHYKTGEIHKYRIINIKKDSFELKSDYKNAKFELYKRRKKVEKRSRSNR